MQSSMNEARQSQAIARWTRIYAQNRSLGVVMNLLIFLVLFAGIGIPSYLGGIAHRSGNNSLFWVCIVIAAIFAVADIYIAVPQWGGRLLARLAGRLYGEGNVEIAIPDPQKRRVLGIALALAYGVCICGLVLLGVLGFIPERSMLPVFSLFAVPFLIGITFLMRPAMSYVMLLWPLLVAIHAVLMLTGAPIVFEGRWNFLNILIPMVGYGLITALISHACSRLALSMLRRLTRADIAAASEENRGLSDE